MTVSLVPPGNNGTRLPPIRWKPAVVFDFGCTVTDFITNDNLSLFGIEIAIGTAVDLAIHQNVFSTMHFDDCTLVDFLSDRHGTTRGSDNYMRMRINLSIDGHVAIITCDVHGAAVVDLTVELQAAFAGIADVGAGVDCRVSALLTMCIDSH
jgi:hypothetical protein